MPFINRVFGWNDVTNFPGKCVVVLSHSSYWDIFVAWLYTFTPGLKNVKFLVKPQLAAWYYFPLHYFMNFIYAPRNEVGGNGSTNSICEQFMSDTSILFLSPKGTIKNRPWRSGYYHIAKMSGVKIYPASPDYTNRHLIFGEPVDPKNMSLADVEKHLQLYLGKNNVLCPENAEYPITDICSCPYESYIPFDFCAVSLIAFFPYMGVLLYRGFWTQLFLTAASVGFAWKYHLDYEGTRGKHTLFYQRAEAIVGVVAMSRHAILHFLESGFSPMTYTCFFTGLFFYLYGTPRGSLPYRGKYVISHSIYHILCALTALSLL